jgi:hypothetical protein
MKAYSQFLKELPSKKVVFAFGAFQPPTISHELLVKTVDNLATEQKAAKAIYASINEDLKKNPIPPHRKAYYLKRMFPEANIKTAESLIEAAKKLNERYKNAVMVAPSDRVAEYQKLLEKHNGKDYNFDSIMVVSSGQLDPDADTSKLREAVKKGDFELFKESMPQNFTSVDTKRLMNEMRQGMGLELIKEQVKLATDWLRESYYRGEILKIGQVVESKGQQYEIVDRGSNYLVVVDSTGSTHRKWITDVQVVEDYNPANPSDLNTKQVSYKGYTTKNFDTDQQVKAAFDRLIGKPDQDPVAILNLIKATDTYLGVAKQAEAVDDITKQQEKTFGDNLQKSQELLVKLGDIMHHIDYMNHTVHTVQQVKAKYHTGTFADTFGESKIQGVTMISFKQFDKEINELSTTTLSSYKKKAADQATAADKAGDYEKGNKRFSGIIKATKKQFDNDLKKEETEQIDEISQKLAGDYYGAATKKHLDKVGMKPNMYGRIEKDMGKQRKAGVDRALDRVTGARKTNEAATDHYAEAEMHLSKANDADAKGDKKSFHAHMSDHHDSMSEWHDSKGRSASADKHAEKADYHHEKSLSEEVVSEATPYYNKPSFLKKMSRVAKQERQAREKKEKEAKPVKEETDYEYAVSLLDEAIASIDKGEYDYEGAMARTQLQTLVRNSQELINMLTMDENMPEWVQSKVTLAQDYISSVRDYLKSRQELGEETVTESGGPVVFKKGNDHVEKYGDNSFAVYKDGKKTKFYKNLNDAKSSLSESAAINRPDLGMTDGSDVFKYADLARMLGIQQPFAASGERSNDDLEAKYGDTPLPDVKQAMAGKTSQTSQIPLIPLSLHTQKTRYRLGEEVEFEELDEESFYEEIDAVAELEDVIDAYEDKELVIIDEDTDEEYELSELQETEQIDEAISRMERIRRKARFARTKSKREMRTKIALKKTSSMPVLNNRAKRLAINMIKKRMLKKDPNTASVQERERVETFIKSRPQIVQRLARRLVPRVRQVEKARLRGKKYKGTM